LWSLTKKRLSDILADENREIFREKIKFVKFSRVWKFFENRGKPETEEKCIMASGGWTPLEAYLWCVRVQTSEINRSC